MYRMAMCSFLITDASLDRARLMKLAVVHDLAEALVGDIVPHDTRYTKEQKRALEEVRTGTGIVLYLNFLFVKEGRKEGGQVAFLMTWPWKRRSKEEEKEQEEEEESERMYTQYAYIFLHTYIQCTQPGGNPEHYKRPGARGHWP